MSDTEGGQPAGWYPDPEMADTVRYWDGSAWTDHRAPAGQEGSPAGVPTAQAAGEQSTEKKADPVAKGCGLGCVGLVVVLLIFVVIGALSGGDDDEPGGGEYGARDVCETFVKARLKSPSTADFSETSASKNAGGSWTVSGAVDSENGFGASIRNTYVCTVSPSGGDNWRLDDMQFSGN